MSEVNLIDITRWWKERANPDYDDDSVDVLVETDNGLAVDALPGKSETPHVRFKAKTEIEGEEVDYTLDISEPLLREAVEMLDEADL